MMRVMYTSLFLVLTCASQAQSYVPEKQEPKMKIKPVVKIKAYSFDMSDVQLLDGPFKTAMEADARYLALIEPDRLLADFREPHRHNGHSFWGHSAGPWLFSVAPPTMR